MSGHVRGDVYRLKTSYLSTRESNKQMKGLGSCVYLRDEMPKKETILVTCHFAVTQISGKKQVKRERAYFGWRLVPGTVHLVKKL